MNYTKCKGCRSIIRDGTCAHEIHHPSICPCSTCLIKGMCSSGCDAFNDLVSKNDFYLTTYNQSYAVLTNMKGTNEKR